jgi:hypothetical protein
MLTACGGLIQALAHGWFRATTEEDLAQVPRLTS